jgi:hypothetical protein
MSLVSTSFDIIRRGGFMDIVAELRREATKLKSHLDRINAAIDALNGRGPGRKRGGYKLSAATRRKMSIATKKRWALRKREAK